MDHESIKIHTNLLKNIGNYDDLTINTSSTHLATRTLWLACDGDRDVFRYNTIQFWGRMTDKAFEHIISSVDY